MARRNSSLLLRVAGLLLAALAIVIVVAALAGQGQSKPVAAPQTEVNPTAIARAVQTQEAIGLPPPEPTRPPLPGEPAADPQYRLQHALKWTPYDTGVHWVLYDGKTVSVGFGIEQSIYPYTTARNGSMRVRAILGVLSQVPVSYSRVVLYGDTRYLLTYAEGGTQTPPLLSAPLRLVYSGDVVRSHTWVPYAEDEKLYEMADSAYVAPSLDYRLMTPEPAFVPHQSDEQQPDMDPPPTNTTAPLH